MGSVRAKGREGGPTLAGEGLLGLYVVFLKPFEVPTIDGRNPASPNTYYYVSNSLPEVPTVLVYEVMQDCYQQ